MYQLLSVGILCCAVSYLETQNYGNQQCPIGPVDLFINGQFIARCGWKAAGLLETALDFIIVLLVLFNYTFFRRLLSLLLLSQVFFKLHFLTITQTNENTTVFYFVLGCLLHFFFAVLALFSPNVENKSSPPDLPQKHFSNVRIPGTDNPNVVNQKPIAQKQKKIKVVSAPKGDISKLMSQIEQLNKETEEKHRLEALTQEKEVVEQKVEKTSQKDEVKNEDKVKVEPKVEQPINQHQQIQNLLQEESTLISAPIRRTTKKKTQKATTVAGNVETKTEEVVPKKNVFGLQKNGPAVSLSDVLGAKGQLKSIKK